MIEVIGHTDEQVIRSTQKSNLDELAIGAINGEVAADRLIPVDNAGLGLARAIAVAAVLRSTGYFGDAKILPLSAAQVTLPGDKISDGRNAGSVASRRRIEIRVRRSNSRDP